MMETRYTSTGNLRHLYTRHGRKMPVRTESLEAFIRWQQEARSKLAALLALDRYAPCDALPLVYERMPVKEAYLRERCIVQTHPEVWMPFFLLYRREGAKKRPAVMLLPEDGAGKFGIIWADDYAAMRDCKDAEVRARMLDRWAFAFALADAGYLVVAPDLPGTGERREWMDWGEANFFRSSRRPVHNAAIALGLNLGGINAWELRRLADYLAKRKDCDGRIAVGGVGDAGAQALLYAAVDDRVCCTFVRDCYAGFEGSMLMHGFGCASNYVPSMWQWFDCCDIGALIAPRSLHVETVEGSAYSGPNGLGNVLPQAEQTCAAYALCGASGNFSHDVLPQKRTGFGPEAMEGLARAFKRPK